MKKIYSSLGTLFCVSFLFTLNSCTTDSPVVSDETLGTVDAKYQHHNFNSRNADAVPANIAAQNVSSGHIQNELFEVHYVPDSFPVRISTYSVQAETNNAVDPDWKNLITHFIEVDGGTEQLTSGLK
jgi:hypothetical protein